MAQDRAADKISTTEKVVALTMFLTAVIGAMALFVQCLIWMERWRCESRLAYMGLEGTTPAYSAVCHVHFSNGKTAPLDQIRWGPDGNNVPPA